MPVIKIYAVEGKTPVFKEAVRRAIRHSVAQAFHLMPQDVTQFWLEFDGSDLDGKGADFIYIEVLALSGRSTDAKRKLYRMMVDRISAGTGVKPDDVLIQLFDIPKENCGIRGGQMAADIDLGFRVDV